MLKRRKDWDKLVAAIAAVAQDGVWKHSAADIMGLQGSYAMGIQAGLNFDLLDELIRVGRPGLAARYAVTGYERHGPGHNSTAPPGLKDYTAAGVTALAGCGLIPDSPAESERPSYRAKSRRWLADDYAQWKECLKLNPTHRDACHKAMKHWLADADFRGVRDEPHVANLPADERAEWAKLWTAVRSLLDQTAPAPK